LALVALVFPQLDITPHSIMVVILNSALGVLWAAAVVQVEILLALMADLAVVETAGIPQQVGEDNFLNKATMRLLAQLFMAEGVAERDQMHRHLQVVLITQQTIHIMQEWVAQECCLQ
jgi:hypothetical protein